MKKLKNPRKYVERLKDRIKWLDEIRERLISENNHERGSKWFNWSSPVWQRVGYTKSISVDGIKPGQEIIMIGSVKEIHQTLDGNMAVMEFTEVRLRK